MKYYLSPVDFYFFKTPAIRIAIEQVRFSQPGCQPQQEGRKTYGQLTSVNAATAIRDTDPWASWEGSEDIYFHSVY